MYIRLCAAMFLLMATAQAQTITPSKAGPNLLKNGDFEMSAQAPQEWRFSSATPEIFKSRIATQPAGGHALVLTAFDGRMSGYWEQAVPVNPHTKYRASARIKINRGKVMMWILGAKYPDNKTPDVPTEARYYLESLNEHPLVPYFWKPAWAIAAGKYQIRGAGPLLIESAAGDEWKTLQLTLDSGAATELRFSVGAYFGAGEYWFDDLSLQEVTS